MEEPNRYRLPDTRPSITHHGTHEKQDFYVTVGFYEGEDDEVRCQPGEVFVVIAKEGSAVRHFVDGWAKAVSIGLQYGVPWEKFADKVRSTPGHPLLCSVVEAVDACINTRRSLIGADEPVGRSGSDEESD